MSPPMPAQIAQQYSYANAPMPAPAQQPPAMPAQIIDFDMYVAKMRGVYNRYSSSASSKEYDNSF
jgi:hypothetical protein